MGVAFLLLASDTLPQADEHSPHFDRGSRKLVMFLPRNHASVEAALEMAFNFGDGADRDRKKVREIRVSTSPAALGDIRRDRVSSSFELAGKRRFPAGHSFGQLVSAQG
ncbi:hypothetical protein BH11GEM2_BH11GEM2_11360 [soil metagenome]